ncbi:hypothetical protein [Jiangella mangrovi]|uniref:CopG family transcriptional regulator n=1 Tax=Jiangella mangrovi TaxID=1524084 RepID=A0A7W9GXD3_9ACTN|nr:hypothetical protein [Jiangella mangrovi]MBB5791764.1 hypothetical protein [Jiangella mangrovi]
MSEIDEGTAERWVGARASSGRDGMRTTVDMEKDLHKAFRLWCAQNDTKMTTTIRALIVEVLTDEKLAAKVLERVER